ncbi:unnamed protein product [Cuscuta europaea]|uniref:Uncharacterized protein n=1 Tax=Cuscuta europaea TaxID=41803 RepID=A0A9P1EB76_CUSEU|nr:unnamed protein product [Cuscuta europaea]
MGGNEEVLPRKVLPRFRLSSSLISLVKVFLLNPKNQEVKVCDICATQGHPTDSCPSFHEEHVNALNFQGHQQKRYGPHSNTYNPGWRDHPNLRYGNPQQQSFPNQQSQSSNSNMSTEDMFRTLATSNHHATKRGSISRDDNKI